MRQSPIEIFAFVMAPIAGASAPDYAIHIATVLSDLPNPTTLWTAKSHWKLLMSADGGYPAVQISIFYEVTLKSEQEREEINASVKKATRKRLFNQE